MTKLEKQMLAIFLISVAPSVASIPVLAYAGLAKWGDSPYIFVSIMVVAGGAWLLQEINSDS